MALFGQLLSAAGKSSQASLNESQKPSPGMPIIIAKRCVRARHIASTCTACVDACPVDAMRLIDKHVKLHVPNCTLCGACAAVCPVDALYVAKPGGDALDKAFAEAKQSGTLAVRCEMAAREEAPQSGASLRVPCLSGLDFSRLADAAAGGMTALTLTAGDCARCPRANPKEPVAETDGNLQGFFESAGAKTTVTLKRAPRTVDMSRRRLFGGFLRKSGADAQAAPAPDSAFARIADEPEKRLPDSRRRFIDAMKTFAAGSPDAPAAADGLLVTVTGKADACSMCGICEMVCPTEAIKTVREVEGFRVSCVRAHCVGCGLCADICFPHALSLAPLTGLAAALDEKPETILFKKTASVHNSEKDGSAVHVPVYRT